MTNLIVGVYSISVSHSNAHMYFQDALVQHVKRVILQAGIWSASRQAHVTIPSPEEFGWSLHAGQWEPLWMTLPEAAKACTQLIKCGCKSERGCRICKCIKSGLNCTDLCSCNCEKN